MKKIYKLAANFSHILRLCTIGALAILGILLTRQIVKFKLNI
ncbi:hypothetical protein [Limosilactobacillus reuteri]|nr:hypothetical protein [Limosilactobacillus reuteri]